MSDPNRELLEAVDAAWFLHKDTCRRCSEEYRNLCQWGKKNCHQWAEVYVKVTGANVSHGEP